MKNVWLALLTLLITACGSQPEKTSSKQAQFDQLRMQTVLAEQDEEIKKRFPARNPLETMKFFGIERGDTVVEMLPGQGWYTKILLPYLGEEGRLIGVDYSSEMWPNFPFATPEFIEQRKKWPKEWPSEARKWGGEDVASVEAYALDTIPESLNGQADVVLFIRAMHNLARFEQQGGYLTAALQRSRELLKPGGVIGIVQHAVDESYDDAWADGSRGYLKSSFLKREMEEAGFEFVGETDINRNPKDKPGSEDIVWRLPPSFSTSEHDPQLRMKMQQLGESNRVTLLFRKPH